MENSMTIRLSKFSSSDTLIKHLLKRAEAIDFLVELLKQGEKARVELDRIFAEKFGWTVGSATALLDWFRTYGWVKSEVRAEEKRMVNFDECNSHLSVKVNGDGTVTVQKPYKHTKYIIHDPVIETDTWGEIHVTGKQEVQVKRKYYTWVA